MQPKAAKKIGGMTPKKMTGGEEDTKEFDFDGTKYSIKKTQKDDKLEICVSAAMPTGEAPAAMVSAEEAAAEAERRAKEEAEAKGEEDGPPGTALGGKKKRKSSKKRKSMKKKGGMKRKSMKVKA